MSQNVALNLFIIENIILIYLGYRHRDYVKGQVNLVIEKIKARFK